MKTWSILSTLFLFAACATQPVPTSQARLVPDARIFDRSLITPQEGHGQVIVKRDSGFIGSGCRAHIFVNAAPAADLSPGEKVVFSLPEGRHILGARTCGNKMIEVEADVTAVRPLVFRVGLDMGGLGLYPTAF